MMRMPWKGKFVPHAALDVLRGCNCVCPYCYNTSHAIAFKPFDVVCRELDALLRLRRLQTVSISGGEPLMHPEICRIVEEIHRRGICVAVLSNGILLTDEMAGRLHQAGCDLLVLHIQAGQGRPDLPNPTAARAEALLIEKGRLVQRHGMSPVFATTLDPMDEKGCRDAITFFAHADTFERSFMTVARDFHALANPHLSTPDIDEAPILNLLDAHGFRPFSFIGGRLDKNRPRIYIFHSVLRMDKHGQRTGWHIVRVSMLERIFLTLHRWMKGRSVFLEKSSSGKIKMRLLLNAVMGGHLSALPFALRAIFRGERLQAKHIIMELMPFRRSDGQVEWCDDCPDAVLKDGVLYPICLSDMVPNENPMTEDAR